MVDKNTDIKVLKLIKERAKDYTLQIADYCKKHFNEWKELVDNPLLDDNKLMWSYMFNINRKIEYLDYTPEETKKNIRNYGHTFEYGGWDFNMSEIYESKMNNFAISECIAGNGVLGVQGLFYPGQDDVESVESEALKCIRWENSANWDADFELFGYLLKNKNIKNTNTPIFLCINKIDLLKNKQEIDKIILEYKDKLNFKGIYPISALENQNIEHVINDIKEILPEGPKYYPDNMITDHPEGFLIAEIIREKVLINTEEEVPHSVAVVIDMLRKNEDNPDVIDCYASIYVERKSQKGIIIGAGGSMLKKIGSQARKDIKNILGSKLYLEIWVKVKEDWRNRENALKVFGYGSDNF